MRVADVDAGAEAAFTAFVRDAEGPVRRALVAGFGEVGRDAAEEAFVHAWRHWDRVSSMDNPRRYVYRVGHRAAQKLARRGRGSIALPDVPDSLSQAIVEPGLPAAMAVLTEQQRAVVVLVHGYGLSQYDAARLLGITRSSVQRHLERGLVKLRRELGVMSGD
jgi:RNA polymerase sigma-70 factor (ECF subfamily)